jgi:hypothetical protein
MSLVVLKRKTGATIKNVSTGQEVFSLNGGHRNAGYIGQDTRSRTIVRSLYRNGALKNHGGIINENDPGIVRSSDMMCVNDASVIKASTVSTGGMLATKHRWLRRPFPYATVKTDNNRHLNQQGLYIENLARKAILGADSAACPAPPTTEDPTAIDCACGKKKEPKPKPITKDALPTKTGAEYIRMLNKKCANLDIFYVQKSTSNVPFACGRKIVAV